MTLMRPARWRKPRRWSGAILEHCVAVGGTITGEHGVGREKINQMCVQFTAGEIETFAAIKGAFDPKGLLNPGKTIPTLARCSEYGAMHVHGGKLPFAHLDRFLEAGDLIDTLAAQVREASAAGAALEIVGGGTKGFYGRSTRRRAAASRRPHRCRRL